MTSPIIYLASPYSDDREEVRMLRARLAVAAAALLKIDREQPVFCPIAHLHEMFCYAGERLPMSWEFWRQIDIPILRICGRLIVLTLPGWEYSQGVKAEMEEARRLGLPCEFSDLGRTVDRAAIKRMEALHLEKYPGSKQ